jgi:subfamily B ATP-binding cassette protein MsbA
VSRADGLTSASARQVYARLLRYAKPYWGAFAISIVGMLGFAATEPAFAAMIKPLLDGSFVDRNPEVVRTMPLLLILLFLVRGVMGFVNTYFLKWVGRRVVADLRQEMFEHLLRLPTRYYDAHSSGGILSRFTFNVENVASATTSAVTTVIRDGFTIIGLMAYMLYIDVALSAIFLLVGPAMVLAIRYATKRFRRVSKRIQDRVGELTHVVQEAIEAQRVVKAFGGQVQETERFRQVNERTRSLQMKMIATEAVSVPLVQLIAAVAIAVIVYLSTLQGLREDITVGTFMSFVVAMGLLLGPIKRLTAVNAQLQRGLIAAESLFDLLDSTAEADTGTRTLERAKGRVEYRAVSHVYADDKGAVLRDIELSVEPGESVAFVGRSGSGKSTLVSLLPRFYDATGGQILVDGIDVRELTLKSLRAQVSVVTQDVVLFNDTVANNIAYAAGGA